MFVFRDKKGFWAHPERWGVLSVDTLEKLNSFFTQNQKSFTPKQQENMQKGLALLNSLPTTEIGHILNAFELPCFNGHQTYLNSHKGHKPPLKCVIGMTAFSTSKGYHATSEMLKIDEKTENYGWQILTEYEKYAKDVNVLFVSSPLFSSLHPHYQKNHEFIKKSFLKKIKGFEAGLNKDFFLHVSNPTEDLVNADCFAIYMGGRNPGFLDGRGNTAMLSGARLFDSAASAKTTISSRGLGAEACVVSIKAQMTGMALGEVLRPGMEPLREAIVALDRQKLQDALGVASEQDLEEALAVKKKRRM